MMTLTMTPEARQRFDEYLERARLSLRGTSVEADEVERDVRAHVEEALQGKTDPILAPELDEVLTRLGSPDQWVPEDEIPFWRRWMTNFVAGSEDWRLAYTCFGLTLVGFLLFPVGGFVLIAGAYLLARATVSITNERGEDLGARRWLIYPVLVFINLAILTALLFTPIIGFGATYFDSVGDSGGFASWLTAGMEASPIVYGIAFTLGVAGIWWMLLSLLATFLIEPVRATLTPLANGLKKRHLIWLAVIGVVFVVAGGITLYLA